MFSCEYCEIFKNTYFEEHLQTTAFTLLVLKFTDFFKLEESLGARIQNYVKIYVRE